MTLSDNELGYGIRLIFTHTLNLGSVRSNMNRRFVHRFVMYTSVVNSGKSFMSDLRKQKWSHLSVGDDEYKMEKLGEWDADSSRNRDIRMRWVMQFMAEIFADDSWPLSERMLMNDIYNWIMEEKPCIEAFKEQPFRAAFVHRLLSTTASDRPSDVMRKDDILLSLEDLLPWLEGEFHIILLLFCSHRM